MTRDGSDEGRAVSIHAQQTKQVLAPATSGGDPETLVHESIELITGVSGDVGELIGTSAPGTSISRTMFIPEEPPAKGFLIAERDYLRVQSRIRNEMGNSAASIWLAVSFTFLGTALTTFVTWLVTPVHMVGIPAGSNSMVGAIAIGSLLLSIVSGLAHLSSRRNSKHLARDICEEMDAYSSRGP